mgnify:CR=1 FL=1|tara:strand:- start:58458 stop:59366 length:909 start_codon:yes stop_codon:yes gene_type:complete
MKIFLDNVNLNSTSGPNHFGTKLNKYISRLGATCTTNLDESSLDVQLSFIESIQNSNLPLVQRLDGIYFDIDTDNKLMNSNLQKTYENSAGVIFQSEYCRDLCFKYLGAHDNHTVIHNGADYELIDEIEPLQDSLLDKFDTVWTCASRWRPWKRLRQNVEYFINFSGENDCLVVAGNPPDDEVVKHNRVFYVGRLPVDILFSLYKRSKYFIHLARYDACPNVVVDARASGCQIICSSLAGTKEVAGPNALVVEDVPWDLEPVSTSRIPDIKFDNVTKNTYNTNIDMTFVAKNYLNFLQKTLQ